MSKHPLIIALTGKPGVGKDTVASLLEQVGFHRIAFADKLRREVAEAFRIDERMLTERETKEWDLPALAIGMCCEMDFVWDCLNLQGLDLGTPRSARWMMQHWGDWRRKQDPNYFTAPVERWIRRNLGVSRTRMVITDLRFPNEEAMLRHLPSRTTLDNEHLKAIAPPAACPAARIVRVHRPNVAALNGEAAQHASEQYHAAMTADYDLANDGSLNALGEATMQCLADLTTKGEET